MNNSGLCILQTIIFSVIGGKIIFGSDGYSALEFAPWAEVIMDKYPQLYNPTHGIFYSRSMRQELYKFEYPVSFSNQDGYVRKILLNDKVENIYQKEWVFINSEGDIIEPRIKTKKVDSGEFTYLNITENVHFLKVCEEINIAENEYVDIPGWGMYKDEGEFCWMRSKGGFLIQDKKIAQKGLRLEILPCSWIKDALGKEFELNILINGKYITKVSEWNYDENNVIFIEPEILHNIQKENGYWYIELNSNSVGNSSSSEDNRELSYLLRYIGIITGENIENGIYFYSENYNADSFNIQGMSEKEEYFSWSEETEICLKSRLGVEFITEKIRCTIELFGVFNKQQSVTIYVNEDEVFREIVLDGNNIEFEFGRPQNGLIDMRIELPDAISPYELGMSSDERQLALAIRKISFQAEE